MNCSRIVTISLAFLWIVMISLGFLWIVRISWKVHSLPNHDFLAESNYWEYFQLISTTLHAYRSTGTWCALKIWSSRYCRSLIPLNWMIFSHHRALDVYTERISLSLCLRGWLFGWIHSVDPWYLLTWHQGTEPSISEVLQCWIVLERRTYRSLFQIYTMRN